MLPEKVTSSYILSVYPFVEGLSIFRNTGSEHDNFIPFTNSINELFAKRSFHDIDLGRQHRLLGFQVVGL